MKELIEDLRILEREQFHSTHAAYICAAADAIERLENEAIAATLRENDAVKLAKLADMNGLLLNANNSLHQEIKAEQRLSFRQMAADLTVERDALRAALANLQRQKPVAWLHSQDGRVDCIHDEVKRLWLRAGQPHGFYREKIPCKVEHYTTPLFLAAGASKP